MDRYSDQTGFLWVGWTPDTEGRELFERETGLPPLIIHSVAVTGARPADSLP
jgi:hypothetical protein